MSNVAGALGLFSNNFSHTNLLILLKIQTGIINDGDLKLGQFDIFDMLFPFWHSVSHSSKLYEIVVT